MAAALGAAAIALPAFAQDQPAGSLGIRLAEAPVARKDDPRALRSIIDHVEPGTTIDRRIEVVSTIPRTVDVDLYVGSAVIRDGSFLPSEDENEGELPAWSRLSSSRLSLAPGERAEITASITVPLGARTGERYGVIWAELPPGGENIQLVNRVGVRVYLSVGEGDEPASDFEVDQLVAGRSETGAPFVEALVTNTGGRALDMTGELRLLDGPAGLAAGPFPAQKGTTIAPAQSAPMRVLLDPELPEGPWLARLTATSGTLSKSVEATIVFPEAAGQVADAVEAEPVDGLRRWLVPLAVGLLLLMLIALILFFLWWKRRKDEEEEEEERRRAAIGANGAKPARKAKRERTGAGKT